MAAGAWKINKNAKLKLGSALIDLDAGNVFKLSLHSIGASANLISGLVSIWSSIGSQVTAGGASTYITGGTTLSSNTWAISGQNAKFDSSDWVITGSIASIKYAVIRVSSGSTTSGLVLCYSTLSGTGFSVTGTNTLTIQMNSSGIFTLS